MSHSRKSIILDTNLIVSAFLSPEGPATEAIDIADTYFDMICSQDIVTELIDVMKREKFDRYTPRAIRAELLRDYLGAVRIVDDGPVMNDCRDPKDDKFLSLARSSKSRLIISWDKRDLLSMHPYHGVNILSIRDFIENFRDYL